MRTPTAKLTPPLVAPGVRAPQAVLDRLDEALERRLTVVTAGAGFGKTTLLAQWAQDQPCAWYVLEPRDAELGVFVAGLVEALRLRAPGLSSAVSGAVTVELGPDADDRARAAAVASLLATDLEAHGPPQLVLVLDDLHEAPPGSATAAFVEAFARGAPPNLHLVVTTRHRLPFPVERMRARGEVLDIDGVFLMLDRDGVAQVLHRCCDDVDRSLVDEVARVTGGWPAAVRLAGEALRHLPPGRRPAALERLGVPGGPVYGYLAEEVFANEGPAVISLLGHAALLYRFNLELLEHLGVPEPGVTLADLRRRGLFLESSGGVGGWHALGSLVREVALDRIAPRGAEARGIVRAAADWCHDNGFEEESLRLLRRSGDRQRLATVLVERGDELIRAGEVDAVLGAAAEVPSEHRTPELERLHGQALQIRGDWAGALSHLEAAATGPTLPPGLAWRTGLIHHLRGDLDRALEVYARGAPAAAPPRPDDDQAVDPDVDVDRVLLDCWAATAFWLRGQLERAAPLAAQALQRARLAGESRALAAAHTVSALVTAAEGDRRSNDEHYLLALHAAEEANDLLQVLRIRTNRGSLFLEEAAYDQALTETEHALHLAELTGFAAFEALARCNRAEILLHLGRLDEAVAETDAAKRIFERLGSSNLAYAHQIAGDVHRERGERALARAAYEEGLELAESTGDVQVLVPLLAGLARVTVSDDVERASALADRARGAATGLSDATAELSSGWVARLAGDREAARAHGERALRIATQRRGRASAAEAEMLLATMEEGRERRQRLERAVAAWARIGDPLWIARAELALARETGAPAATIARSELALTRAGVRSAGVAEHRLIIGGDNGPPGVAIGVLGVFRVVHDGVPVAASTWRSRKARELLQILVTRRGTPIAREELGALLWPDESPEQFANRLSVALTVVRSVLDPDRQGPASRFVTTGAGAVLLERSHLEIDVDRFLALAEAGLAALREGRVDEATALLEQAEASYTGDVLEEEPYAEWAVSLREVARSSYIEVSRRLAALRADAGDADGATRLLLRLLERDPFDEPAHLALVRALASAGRHGEARRRHRLYVGRMHELGVEALPLVAVLAGDTESGLRPVS